MADPYIPKILLISLISENLWEISRLREERNAVILAHNHPSGVAEPSEAERAGAGVTDRRVEVALGGEFEGF